MAQDVPSPPAEPNLGALYFTDAYLENFEENILKRYKCFQDLLAHINKHEGGLDKFSMSYKEYGIHRMPDNSIMAREWAPGAEGMYLKGDFNEWKLEERYKFTAKASGVWELKIPANDDGSCVIQHLCKMKLVLKTKSGAMEERICPWARRVARPDEFATFYQEFYDPLEDQVYRFQYPHPTRPETVLVYEAHVGVCSWKGEVATYKQFITNIFPRIYDLGYNCLQLMAIMEHANYASVGYEVTHFFATSSRYGTPEELKELIDLAHSKNMRVILDIVHSHASSNVVDGLNQFDGTNACYFHDGPRGFHDSLNARLFNYTSWEVLRFLLSNLRMWVEGFRFDGFRFGGVTSMLYHTHGIGQEFMGHYDEYFGKNVDTESFTYLTLVNFMLHHFYPNFMLTFAEDRSGMPTLCRPVEEGGCGFDYRLAMGLPDMWAKLLDMRDEDWNMDFIASCLLNRRWAEPCISFTECHEQSLAGNRTIAMRIFHDEIDKLRTIRNDDTFLVNRGLALHKMIRLATIGIGGEGYLNFMGNEFAHPGFLDFPREGNNYSYENSRREFYLVDNQLIKFQTLNWFDHDMIHMELKFRWQSVKENHVSTKHNDDKVLVFERGNNLVFIFNFHPHKSYFYYKIGVGSPGTYCIWLDTDDRKYCGKGRLNHQKEFYTVKEPFNGRPYHTFVYIPSRIAIVLYRCEIPMFEGYDSLRYY